jgi:hypothetical protein
MERRGSLFRRARVTLLAEAISSLAEDRELRERLGAAGRDRAL